MILLDFDEKQRSMAAMFNRLGVWLIRGRDSHVVVERLLNCWVRIGKLSLFFSANKRVFVGFAKPGPTSEMGMQRLSGGSC